MTEIVFAVIDNHRNGRKTHYDIIFKTKDYPSYLKYITKKGLN